MTGPERVGSAPSEPREPSVRHLVRDLDRAEGIMRLLSFPALGWVRVVFEVELERSGLTLEREEAVALRDALNAALGEIKAYEVEQEHHNCDEDGEIPCSVCGYLSGIAEAALTDA